MPATLDFAPAARAILKARSIYITVHQRPDGDALGCQLALVSALERRGIRTWPANEDGVPDRYRFLPYSRRVRTGPRGLPARFDAAIVLECGSLERAGNCGPPARRAGVIVNLDHHQHNLMYGRYNLVDPGAPASVLLLESLRRAMHAPLTTDMATNLYTGLLTETGGFRYNNTTAPVLALASRLVSAGIDVKRVGEEIYERSPIRRLRLLGRALGSLFVKGGVSVMTLSGNDFKAERATEADAEDFVEHPRAIAGVKLAVFMRETPDGNVRVSLRAKSRVPVNAIAERFGGGGHAFAAGCTIAGTRLTGAWRLLYPVIREIMGGKRT
jgi:phosphoesterase RecJ-like protein